MSKQRIGIYSGTFDPVHDGHIQFALSALAHAKLDKIYFMVEPRPRRKQGVRAYEHRLSMVRIALGKYAQLGYIVLEQARFDVHKTLPILQRRFQGSELCMLMGDDFIKHLPHWPNIDELSATEIVMGLRKRTKKEVEELFHTLQTTTGKTFTWSVFDAPNPSQSSTAVRRAYRQGQKPTGLTSGVELYIAKHRLYSSSDGIA
jgi:nicotinate-nucleotide adenylyltransferase